MDEEVSILNINEKAKECKTVEDALELVKSEGLELTEEELEQISGGVWSSETKWCCVYCGSEDIEVHRNYKNQWTHCNNCGRDAANAAKK